MGRPKRWFVLALGRAPHVVFSHHDVGTEVPGSSPKGGHSREKEPATHPFARTLGWSGPTLGRRNIGKPERWGTRHDAGEQTDTPTPGGGHSPAEKPGRPNVRQAGTHVGKDPTRGRAQRRDEPDAGLSQHRAPDVGRAATSGSASTLGSGDHTLGRSVPTLRDILPTFQRFHT